VNIKPKPESVEIKSTREPNPNLSANSEDLRSSFHSVVGSSKINHIALVRTASTWKPSTTSETIISQFETWIIANCCKNSPLADHFLTLVKFNVFCVMLSNSLPLRLPAEERMEDKVLSHFPRSLETETSTSSFTPSLQPKALVHSSSSSVDRSLAKPTNEGQSPARWQFV
jgi:hypothetical protein